MSFHELHTPDGLNAALAGLLGDLIRKGVVCAVLAPTRQPHKRLVMQTLITDPEALVAIDPFAPVVTSNAAKQVAALTHRPAGRPIAVVLRSCEVRAVIELAKLHQATLEDLLILGIDCLGRYENKAYQALVAEDDALTTHFLERALTDGQTTSAGVELSRACQICEHPVPDAVDLRLAVLGADVGERLWVEALTGKGVEALQAAALAGQPDAPAGRESAVASITAARQARRDALFARVSAEAASLPGLEAALAGCVNCYNCRVACPVCYCRECVFLTDTFRHDGEQYAAWAAKRGRLKLPTDTTFYHLTRMVHMSTLCVGCGQCSSACPNDLPVMELFRSVATATQRRFDYVPGRAPDEPQPLAVFFDEELGDVTGQTK